MDPLSEVLSFLKPRSYVSGGWNMGGEWSVRFGCHTGIKCYSLFSGECWLALEGVAEPVRLTAGDCFLLPSGRPFRLTSDLGLTPVEALQLFQPPLNGSVSVYQGGGKCFGVGGHFTFAGDHAGILLGVLPPVVHIRKEADKAAMRWALERMLEELREPQPGGHLLAQQLAYLMLVQALRLHLEEGTRGRVGWLFALADTQMSAAIGAMHDDPAHGWTLQELAERVGMSRSTFALKFKETVGTAPMEYLTRWRMLLAGDRLTNSSDAIAAIGRSLGYKSESAFSTAFKRLMGCSPRQYGRRSASVVPGEAEAAGAGELAAVAS